MTVLAIILSIANGLLSGAVWLLDYFVGPESKWRKHVLYVSAAFILILLVATPVTIGLDARARDAKAEEQTRLLQEQSRKLDELRRMLEPVLEQAKKQHPGASDQKAIEMFVQERVLALEGRTQRLEAVAPPPLVETKRTVKPSEKGLQLHVDFVPTAMESLGVVTFKATVPAASKARITGFVVGSLAANSAGPMIIAPDGKSAEGACSPFGPGPMWLEVTLSDEAMITIQGNRGIVPTEYKVSR